jgi:hypothetical protein
MATRKVHSNTKKRQHNLSTVRPDRTELALHEDSPEGGLVHGGNLRAWSSWTWPLLYNSKKWAWYDAEDQDLRANSGSGKSNSAGGSTPREKHRGMSSSGGGRLIVLWPGMCKNTKCRRVGQSHAHCTRGNKFLVKNPGEVNPGRGYALLQPTPVMEAWRKNVSAYSSPGVRQELRQSLEWPNSKVTAWGRGV